MNNICGMPKGVTIAINDLLDHCSVKPGQEIILLAQIDGLYGGDNLVDQELISWIQTAIQYRGANTTIIWFDEPAKLHHWRCPPVIKASLKACDLFITHSFDLTGEEIMEFRRVFVENKIPMIRNFATTTSLMNTTWAQTPQELVNEIRYQATLPIQDGLPWQLTDDNGSHLEGFIKATDDPDRPGFNTYSKRREEGYNRPWPEWVYPRVKIPNTSGILIFDRMLSWWSRYIGISPYFSKPIKLTIENCRIKKIEGGDEAEALKRFLVMMSEYLGDGVYDFSEFHSGVHPQANVAPHQCPNILHRRLIEHAHCSNIHFHIGAPPSTENYPYWMHCTADIRTATFRVGDTLLHDRGYMTALGHPAVRDIAAKYPGRPRVEPVFISY